MQELAAALGRERVQLEYLLFKLLELQHLLRSRDPRFLRWATAEVARAVQRLQTTERECDDLSRELAETIGVTRARISLPALAGHLDEPWRTIVTDHVGEARRLTSEVEVATHVTRALAAGSGHAVATVLDEALHPATGVPHPRGRSSSDLATASGQPADS